MACHPKKQAVKPSGTTLAPLIPPEKVPTHKMRGMQSQSASSDGHGEEWRDVGAGRVGVDDHPEVGSALEAGAELWSAMAPRVKSTKSAKAAVAV